MDENKYISKRNLADLIQLIKGDIRKKQDAVQFNTMPDPAANVGKIVQYTGVSVQPELIKGSFYYSNGTRWVAVNTVSPIKIVDTLPNWADAEDGIIYYSIAASKMYIRSSTPGEWYGLNENYLAVKQYPDSDHYDPDAEYPAETAQVKLTDLELTSITDSEIDTLISEV